MSAWRLGTRVGGNTNQSYEDKHYKKEVHSVQDLGRPTRRSWTQQAAPDRAQRWVSDMEHLFRGLPKSLELGRGSPRKYRVERRYWGEGSRKEDLWLPAPQGEGVVRCQSPSFHPQKHGMSASSYRQIPSPNPFLLGKQEDLSRWEKVSWL